MKKLLAILLCLLLLTTAVPMSVFAYENHSNMETVSGSFDLLGKGFNALSDPAISELELVNQPSIFNENVKSTLLATSYTTADAFYAKSVQELMSSFGIEYGNDINLSIPVYTAKIGFENKFSSGNSVTNRSVNESIYFYYYQQTITNRYSLQKNTLDGQLNQTFLAELDALNADRSLANIEEFFNTWGTHILTSYDKGGFLEYAASAHSTSVKCTENGKVTETIGASVGLGNASVGTTFNVAKTMDSEFASDEYILNHSWTCCGGQSNLVGIKSGTDEEVVLEADAWKESISHEHAALLPQSTQWKPIWECIPDGDEYADLIRDLKDYYTETVDGVNAEFFAKYSNDFRVKNADAVYYVSPSTDAAGNNLIYEMDVADSYVVDPKSKINIVDVGTDLSNMYIDINPAGLATVDLDTGYVTFSDRLKDGDEVTIRIKGLLPDGTPGDNVRAQGTYKIKQEGTTADGIQLFAGGYGDATRPYLIADATQLSNIRNANASANCFALIQDIDVGNFEPLPSFIGTFDGNGYTLSGGRYTQSTNGQIGLFKEIAAGATVKNVTLKDFYIDSTNKENILGRVYVGLLCGENKGTIENVVIDSGRIDTQMGSIHTDYDNYLQVGLLCGRSEGVILRCGVYSTSRDNSSVTAICEVGTGGDESNDLAEVCVGAIVGYVHSEGTVTDAYAHDCIVTGGAHSTTDKNIFGGCKNHGRPRVYAGGAMGCIGGQAKLVRVLAYDNDLSNCYCILDEHNCDWKGEVKHTGTLVGLQEGDSQYTNCYGETGEGAFIGNVSSTSGNTNKLNSLTEPGIISKLNGYAAEWYQPDGAGHIRIAQPVSLTVNSAYLDTEYFVGEPLRLIGLEVKQVEEGSVSPLDALVNGFTVTGYDPNVVGEQTLTVTCGKLSGTYTVTVKEPMVTALSVITLPDQTLFYEGDDLDYTGLSVMAIKDNGSSEIVAVDQMEISVVEAENDSKTVVVTYAGCSTEFMIQVCPVVVTGMKILTAADKNAFTVGENFSADGLTLELFFNNSAKQTLTVQDVEIVAPDMSSAGTKTVTVVHTADDGTRLTCSYDIVVEGGSTPGDVNGDGKINNKDLGLLQQHLAEWEVAVDLSACDVNNDGRVNNKDLGLLQQYLAEWDVVLG